MNSEAEGKRKKKFYSSVAILRSMISTCSDEFVKILMTANTGVHMQSV